MKLNPDKKTKKINQIIGIFTIIYGIVFIIIDIIHYYYGIRAEKEFWESGILAIIHIPYEVLEYKIYNIIIHVLFILAGISLLKKKSTTWHLYNIAFLGWLLKFPILLFWDEVYRTNWISSLGIPYILSIIGIIYFNKAKTRNIIQFTKRKIWKKLLSYSVGIFLILSVISYNLGWTPRKQLTNTLNEAIEKNTYSKYKYHIKNILDSLSINWDNIHGIKIAIVNGENKPIYSEELAIGESDLLCFPYKYDNRGNLLQEFDPKPFYNAIIYKYDWL